MFKTTNHQKRLTPIGTTPCKNICVRYKAKRKGTLHRYGDGFKRCSVCCIRIKWDGKCCPCCGYRLSTRVRDGKQRKILAETRVRY